MAFAGRTALITGAGGGIGSAVARAFAAAGAPLLTGHPIEATYYWGNLMPALSYAVDHGAPGAAAAWDRGTTASNFPIQAADYIDNPVWGVRPRTRR